MQPTGRKSSLYSFGIGSELPIANYIKDYSLRIDYALIPLGEFGFNHAVTLNIRYDKEIAALK